MYEMMPMSAVPVTKQHLEVPARNLASVTKDHASHPAVSNIHCAASVCSLHLNGALRKECLQQMRMQCTLCNAAAARLMRRVPIVVAWSEKVLHQQ
jgi:hypothetical protein